MSLPLILRHHRWKLALAVAACLGVAAVQAWRSVPALSASVEPGAGFSSASPLGTPSLAGSDIAIARAVAAQQALQQAEQALQVANELISAPDIPEAVALWSAASDATPALALNPQITEAEVVRLPVSPELEKVPGDRLSVPLPAGRSLVVTVEEAARLPNGDYTWRGYVDGEGDDFPVIFTVGKNSAFATITSWEGSYTMESVGGVGWLYRNITDAGEDSVPAPAGEEQPLRQ